MKHIEVVAAVILSRDGSKVLSTQRGYGEFKGKWEFPGGKIEQGETREEALIREISEELGVTVTVCSFLTTVSFMYPSFHITMHCYVCTIGQQHPELNEHLSMRWMTAEELRSADWLPADVPVAAIMADRLSMQ